MGSKLSISYGIIFDIRYLDYADLFEQEFTDLFNLRTSLYLWISWVFGVKFWSALQHNSARVSYLHQDYMNLDMLNLAVSHNKIIQKTPGSGDSDPWVLIRHNLRNQNTVDPFCKRICVNPSII